MRLNSALTEADRVWIEHHLSLAQKRYTLPDLAAAGVPDGTKVGEGGRFYLPCGHQMGGPQGFAPSDCVTCVDWLTEAAASLGITP